MCDHRSSNGRVNPALPHCCYACKLETGNSHTEIRKEEEAAAVQAPLMCDRGIQCFGYKPHCTAAVASQPGVGGMMVREEPVGSTAGANMACVSAGKRQQPEAVRQAARLITQMYINSSYTKEKSLEPSTACWRDNGEQHTLLLLLHTPCSHQVQQAHPVADPDALMSYKPKGQHSCCWQALTCCSQLPFRPIGRVQGRSAQTCGSRPPACLYNI
jgi:hypothetical protein